jgi:hypothetical protein
LFRMQTNRWKSSNKSEWWTVLIRRPSEAHVQGNWD